MNVMLIELLVVVMNAIKEIAKKILNENVEVININFNYNNASIAVKELLNEKNYLLSSNSHFGKRRDGKKFYPVIEKIENGFNLLFNGVKKYDEIDYKEPSEAYTVSSGNPLKSKPFPMAEEFIFKTLTNKRLYQYPTITGSLKAKAFVLSYLLREGFKKDKSNGYDGLGVENIVFTCSVSQAYYFVLETILCDEDVVIVTGPNYGLFAITPERLNGRVEVINLDEEDNFFVNPSKLAKKIDDVNEKLSMEFKNKKYIPRVKAFLNVNPHNPIGNVMNSKKIDILKGIGDVCLEHGVFVIDDLIYRDLSYNEPAIPLATIPKYFNNTISLFGLSKAYGLASYRAGFVVAPIPICNGLNDRIFCTMNAVPILQTYAVAGAYNGTNKRYKLAQKYFPPLIKEYKYRFKLFQALIEGIDVIKNTNESARIMKDIKKTVKDSKKATILLKGIDNVEIRKGTIPDSGFFAVVNFTKLKGKKINNMLINSESDLVIHMYKTSKFKTIMGQNMSWPYEDEIIGRFDFAINLENLIDEIWKLHLSLDKEFVCIE